MPDLLDVQAYTFEKSTIDTGYSAVLGSPAFYYGMHTVMPSDTLFEVPSGGAEGWLTFNLIWTNFAQGDSHEVQYHYDFANPCPKYCGKTQAFSIE